MISKHFFPKTDKKAAAVIKLQLLFFVMLAVVFLSVVIPFSAIAVFEALLVAFFLFILFVDARKLLGKEFWPVAIFFLFLLAILAASLLVQLMPLEEIGLRFQFLGAIAIVALVFFLWYKVFVSRNFSHGTVISSEKNSALVETEFDFLAGINAGTYRVKAHKHFAAGQKLKLKIGQGLIGRKPVEIIE